jgi:hypothetical protein
MSGLTVANTPSRAGRCRYPRPEARGLLHASRTTRSAPRWVSPAVDGQIVLSATALRGETPTACRVTERAIRHRMQDQQASPSPVRSETLPGRFRTPAGALHRQRRRLGREPLENVLEYRLAHLRCVGEQLSQLLDLHLGGQVLFGAARCMLFGCQVCSPPFFRLCTVHVRGLGVTVAPVTTLVRPGS